MQSRLKAKLNAIHTILYKLGGYELGLLYFMKSKIRHKC